MECSERSGPRVSLGSVYWRWEMAKELAGWVVDEEAGEETG